MIIDLKKKVYQFIRTDFFSAKFFLFSGIIFFALIFRFWGLGQADFLNDDGHYAFRSLGWFDYLASSQQTTPIQWFGKIPWWGNLSFHDHPPLLFFLQWLGFSIFGPSAFAARIFISLLNFLGILFFYFLIKKYKGLFPALLGTFILSISSLAVWISRQSLNDGLVFAFEILYLYFFVSYFYSFKKYYLPLAGIFLGLAIMSKYTAVFIIPASLIYILLYQRKVFRTKEFYIGVLFFVLSISPVIIYNFFVFIHRGHFDASLSHMLGLRPDDFEIIKNKVVNFNFIDNIKKEFIAVYSFSSLSYFLLKIIGSLYLFIKFIFKKTNIFEKIIFWHLIFLFLMFMFMGPTIRYISIIEPLLIVGVIVMIFDVFEYLIKKEKVVTRQIFTGFIVLAISLEFLYSFNTNLTPVSLGQVRWHYAQERSYNFGFNQLDKFISENIYPEKNIANINNLSELKVSPQTLRNKSVLIFDDRISWFAAIWVFNRHLIYSHQPVFSLSQLFQYWQDPNIAIKELKSLGVKDFWFIVPIKKETFDSNASNFSDFKLLIESTELRFEELKIKPVKIYNNQGDLAFKIYHFY